MTPDEYKIIRIPEAGEIIHPSGLGIDRFSEQIKQETIKMTKLKHFFFATLAIVMTSVVASAQAGAGAADNAYTLNSSRALAAGIGFGIAAGLAAIAQGIVGSRAAEGAARNPGAAGQVQTLMIIALALIESLVLFALLIAFVVVTPSANPQ
jgi:F-type H+-transporting ATPase subunit c